MPKNLSREELLIIFKQLKLSDIKQCQSVCRAWYIPARTLLLKQVHLNKLSSVNNFIESFDRDPHPSYFAIVKKIRFYFDYVPKKADEEDDVLCDDYEPNYEPLNKEKLKKLFFSFPNLEIVQFVDCLSLFAHFNDKELCAEFLKSCPKLKQFDIDEDYCCYPRNYRLVYNLQHLLTSITIQGNPYYTMPEEFESVQEYISKFPRLKSVYCNNNDIENFKGFLPIFDHLPNVTAISLHGSNDQVDFAERYLASKTKEEQYLLVERLSKVQYLDLTFGKNFCVNSIKFIRKYLTGLERFYYKSSFNGYYNDHLKQVFRDELLEILGPANEGYIFVNFIEYGVLKRSLTTIMDKILCHGITPAHLETAEKFRSLRCSDKEWCLFTSYLDDFCDITVAGSREYKFSVSPKPKYLRYNT